MYAVARILLGNEEDAADATQACMLAVWEKVADGFDIDTPMAYCLRTVRNHCLRLIQQRHEAVSIESMAEPSYSDTTFEDSEWSARLKDAMAGFPEQERSVVSLSIIGEYSNVEIAESLGITPGNVRVILHRGRTRLRNLFYKEK